MVQRLVFGANVQRVDVRRERLHAFPFQRQHQPPAVILKPLVPVRVSQRPAQMIEIPLIFCQFFHFASPSTSQHKSVWYGYRQKIEFIKNLLTQSN